MSNQNDYTMEPAPLSPDQERLWAIGVHAFGVIFEFFAPLLGYLLLKNRGPFIKHHVIESLNFGITMLVLYALLAVSIVGWLFFWVPPIIWTIMRLYAAYRASLGEFYRYPLILRIVKS